MDCCRFDRFSFDITDALLVGNASAHEVIVRIYSPLDSAHIPIGKQRLHVPAKSIFYSASSGIWQTVWLELVRQIRKLNYTLYALPAKTAPESTTPQPCGSLKPDACHLQGSEPDAAAVQPL